MEELKKAIKLMTEEFKKEFGKNAKIEEEETYTCVFNDAIIEITLVNREMKVDITAGKPTIIDYTIGILEE